MRWEYRVAERGHRLSEREVEIGRFVWEGQGEPLQGGWRTARADPPEPSRGQEV